MARSSSLDSVIETIFQGSNSHSVIDRWRSRETSAPITPKMYIEIPIDADSFELPLLAFEAFRNTLKSPIEYSTLVAQIYSCGKTSSYKSLDAVMRDVLSTKFSRHLCKVEIPSSTNIYYATFGAVFDSNLKPLMMLSWLMEKKQDGDGRIKYHYKRPLLRLNPYPCTSKEDALQRWLCGKMLTTSLETSINTPYYYGLDDYLEQSRAYSNRGWYSVKVEIDACPFTIRGCDVPSVSVTNEGLLQLAADHILEIMQQ